MTFSDSITVTYPYSAGQAIEVNVDTDEYDTIDLLVTDVASGAEITAAMSVAEVEALIAKLSTALAVKRIAA